MYIPAKPAPTMTASKTGSAAAGPRGRGVVSAVMMRVVSLLVARRDLAAHYTSILRGLFQFFVFGGHPCGCRVRLDRCGGGDRNLC
jgi:hypothetical protein